MYFTKTHKNIVPKTMTPNLKTSSAKENKSLKGRGKKTGAEKL